MTFAVDSSKLRRLMPCALCGAMMYHGAIRGPGAALVFRATERDGGVWLPVKHGGPGTLCPDPGPETADWWHVGYRREQHKATMRLAAAARISNMSKLSRH